MRVGVYVLFLQGIRLCFTDLMILCFLIGLHDNAMHSVIILTLYFACNAIETHHLGAESRSD